MERLYDSIIKKHCIHEQEMLFLSGPRQVGKTTVSKNVKEFCDQFVYLNWDDEDHRTILLQGPSAIIEYAGLSQLSEQRPIIALDEIHKRPDWKNFLKGLFDSYKDDIRLIVTGSARLDIYKRGGDSLMGRYFPYRMHPLSVAECINAIRPDQEIIAPTEIMDTEFQTLFTFGGFPKPFINRDPRFSIRWQNLRKQQLLREDIRDSKVIHDLNRLQLLMDLLKQQASNQITYSNLAKLIRTSVDTIRRWIEILEAFFYCYRIHPWSRNITRALIKEPKVFLWDWASIDNPGARAENFIASHLLKATHYWTDCGLGNYGLYYIRTTDQKEIDFVVTKNDMPWFLIEVKLSNNRRINPHLATFQKQLQAPHAFQIVFDLPYVNKNCFESNTPIIVPAKTFLSQLV